MGKAKDQKPRWGWLRDFALLAAVVVGITWYQTRDHVGGVSPAFDLQVLGGDDARVSSESLRGKPTLIYFWAPWCGVCEASSHNVSATHAAVDDANVFSIAVEYRSLDNVRDFVERNDATYPVLLGESGTTAKWAVTSFPTIYVLDADGNVSSSVVGYTTEIGLRARLWWAGL